MCSKLSCLVLTIALLPTSALAVVQEGFVRFDSDIGPYLSQGDVEAIVMMQPFTLEQFSDPDGSGSWVWHQHASFEVGDFSQFYMADVMLHGFIDFYVVEPGDELIADWNLVNSQYYTRLDQSFTPSGEFYVGVIGEGGPMGSAPPFAGWFKVGWVDNPQSPLGVDYVVLESAAAFGERGIIVGTTNAIPEPGTCAIALSSVFAFFGRRARQE